MGERMLVHTSPLPDRRRVGPTPHETSSVMPTAHPIVQPDSLRRNRKQTRASWPARRTIDRVGRPLFSFALVGCIVWMLLQADLVRAAEAHLAAWWMSPWVERGVTASGDTYMLWISENHLVGFQVTVECTAIILLAPLLALGAGLMLSTRVGWLRGIAGITASAIVIVLVNQVRLAIIGVSTQQGGLEAGYEVGHRFTGSAIGIAGFALGLIVLIAVTGVRRRRR